MGTNGNSLYFKALLQKHQSNFILINFLLDLHECYTNNLTLIIFKQNPW
ncbi:hypothetical protein FLJU110815_08010 [Flavobacterium jumunjinense]